jgi:hypothetical protein
MTAESHIVLQLMKMVGDIFLTPNVSRDTFSKISNNNCSRFDFKRHGVSYNQIRWSWRILNSNSLQTVLTLLVTSLCELHSNASMFGGIESTSFKIKYKQLDKRGNQVLKLILK